jgi:alkanesulfonate monooxygenase SsuD/methylene tetrahydromethanopterin reductase-like flavin-dependent oxidoreductase (luciferase family)
MSRPAPRFGLWYDFRNPAGRPFEAFYQDTLDQIVRAEELGFGSVWLTEHHFAEDGYTPSPLVIAAAIGARTKQMRIGTSVVLLPLHDPIRLAEDAATLSILTGGRFDLGLAAGYREIEFQTFGRSLRNRPSLMEEGVEIIRRAWAGESIEFQGKRFRYPDVKVYPTPVSKPRLLLGAMAEPAIDRAARIGDGFLSTLSIGHDLYVAGLEKAGKKATEGSICAGQWVVIDADPEATWARIGDHALYQLNQYIEWGAFGPPSEVPLFESKEQIAENGPYQLWDGPTAVEKLTELLTDVPLIEDVLLWAQLPGESIESGSKRIEFVARHVIPEVTRRLSA